MLLRSRVNVCRRIVDAPLRASLRIFHSSFTSTSRPLESSSRQWQPQSQNEKPFYVTTPIFYVNAAPHVGHLFTSVLADVIKRWAALEGRRSILCTGTDEHGMKVQRAAEAAKSDPRSFCDAGAEVFKTLAAKGDVSYDRFIRTTDADHRDAVQYAWHDLQAKGHIYLSKHEGWYAVSDETFYPQSGVHLVVEPSTGRKIMASIETGKEVEWTSETNYRFRLSAFKDKLLKFYEDNPGFIVPRSRHEEVVSWVKAGLEDLSVSRPSKRLSWGIPVPNDESQTIYVWLDALINYATAAGYPFTPGKETEKGWPADCQVIGKDIVRFHCIYWPAFLMALGLPPPKNVLTHAHWTLGKEKMAKSTGNVVNPFWAIERFGVDVMRYYLAHDGGIQDDADYGNEFIILRYKKDLQGGLGNLVSRITRGKGWSVSRAVQRARDDDLLDLQDPSSSFNGTSPKIAEALHQQHVCLTEIHDRTTQAMSTYDVSRCLKAIMQAIYSTNAFLQEVEPWALAAKIKESPDAHAQRRLDTMIYLSAEAIRIAGICLQPTMPTKMTTLLDMLGVRPERRTLAFAKVGADLEYGQSNVELGKGHSRVLFPPLIADG